MFIALSMIILHHLGLEPGSLDSYIDSNDLAWCYLVPLSAFATHLSSVFCSTHETLSPKPLEHRSFVWLNAMLFPEYHLFCAVKEYLAASNFATKNNVSMEHGFFFCGHSFIDRGLLDIDYSMIIEDDDSHAKVRRYAKLEFIQRRPYLPPWPKFFLYTFIHVAYFIVFLARPVTSQIPVTLYTAASLTAFAMHIASGLLLSEKPLCLDMPGDNIVLGPKLQDVGPDDSDSSIETWVACSKPTLNSYLEPTTIMIILYDTVLNASGSTQMKINPGTATLLEALQTSLEVEVCHRFEETRGKEYEIGPFQAIVVYGFKSSTVDDGEDCWTHAFNERSAPQCEIGDTGKGV
ncbi:hypothetical protein C8J56DRAFT_893070 [Mycena floridula]|nr:hypothetical protein C8J56DRAFT_893070 [Mycena floridula]